MKKSNIMKNSNHENIQRNLNVSKSHKPKNLSNLNIVLYYKNPIFSLQGLMITLSLLAPISQVMCMYNMEINSGKNNNVGGYNIQSTS